MKCNYEKCRKDITEGFILDIIDDGGVNGYCSVSCYLAFLKLLHIQVWGHSEGLEKDYMSKEYLEFFINVGNTNGE